MASDDSGGIISNAIAAIVAAGGLFMAGLAFIRWNLGVGRDARDARDMGLANGKVLAAHDTRLATIEADSEWTKDALDDIKKSLAEVLRRMPQGGQRR